MFFVQKFECCFRVFRDSLYNIKHNKVSMLSRFRVIGRRNQRMFAFEVLADDSTSLPVVRQF